MSYLIGIVAACATLIAIILLVAYLQDKLGSNKQTTEPTTSTLNPNDIQMHLSGPYIVCFELLIAVVSHTWGSLELCRPHDLCAHMPTCGANPVQLLPGRGIVYNYEFQRSSKPVPGLPSKTGTTYNTFPAKMMARIINAELHNRCVYEGLPVVQIIGVKDVALGRVRFTLQVLV